MFENILNGYILITTPSKSDTSIFTRVVAESLTVDNIRLETNSFITLTEEGKLHMTDSSFTNMYSYREGAVLSGGASKTETVIDNSSFINNAAQKGAVFYLSDESYVKCTGCTINDNFAITSGVVEVTLNGYFEFYDSVIFNNYANGSPVSLILDCATTSLLSNTSLYQNHAFSKSELSTEFTS